MICTFRDDLELISTLLLFLLKLLLFYLRHQCYLMTSSLLPRPHPLFNLQLLREGLVTLATKTVPSTPQNRGVTSKLQRANPLRHYCLTYNVTVLKSLYVSSLKLLHNLLFCSLWLVSGCSLCANELARMNRRRVTLERRYWNRWGIT